MLTDNIAARLENNDADWKQLKKHIESNIFSLNRNDDIDFSDKEKAAIRCMGRQEAVRILEAILEPFSITDKSTDGGAERLAKKTGVV